VMGSKDKGLTPPFVPHVEDQLLPRVDN